MKKILKYITLLMVSFMCVSCNENHFPMKGNTLVVTNEYAIDENFSQYTLKYKDTRAKGLGEPTSIIRMTYDRKAFEVGDTIKLVKIDE